MKETLKRRVTVTSSLNEKSMDQLKSWVVYRRPDPRIHHVVREGTYVLLKRS
jgi:hypothetical protein